MTALVLITLLAADPAPAFEGVLPKGATATWLVRFDEQAKARSSALAVSKEGTPWLATGDVLLPVSESAQPMRLTVPIDALAFSSSGVLAVVSGKKFGVVTKRGFEPLADLPRAGFRLAESGADSFLLFEGKQLFRFRAGGGVEHVLDSPEPIDAVASTGERTWISSAGAVLTLEPKPARVLLAADAIVSLAPAGDGDFFYATANEVGLVKAGKRVRWMSGATGNLFARGDKLLLHVPKTGVLSLGPISSFTAHADLVEKGARK